MPEGYATTEARDQDAEAIARLHIASWQATYAEELPQAFLLNQDLAARTAEWRRRLADGASVLVTREGDGIVAFVACGPAGGSAGPAEHWELYNLHVAPLRQRRGLGGRLFDDAARLGRERGSLEMVLWAVRTNSAARAFYEAKGMRWDGGEQRFSLGPGVTFQEVRYRLALSTS